MSLIVNEIYYEVIYFVLCVLQPICLPLPETATILGGSMILGAKKSFMLGVLGTVTGICIMYLLSRFGSKKLMKRFRKSDALEKYQQYVQNNALILTGLLFVIPVLPDEFICIGAAFSGIPFKLFMGIAVLSKVVSVSMIAFSKEIGTVLTLSRTEIIIVELIILFGAAFCMKAYTKRRQKNKETNMVSE